MAILFIAHPSQRLPSDILRAVMEIDPEHNPALQPSAPPAPPGGTWCNKFIAWVTSSLGAPVPFGEYGTPVNAQIVWLTNSSSWRAAGAAEAQHAAALGKVVLATYFNSVGVHGHIALVLPFENGEPRIAQAGAVNFNDQPLSRGFSNLPVVFFIHED